MFWQRVLFALLFATNAARGAEVATGETLHAAIDLSDGSRVVGTLGGSSIPVQTLFAEANIPFRQIQHVRIEDSDWHFVGLTREGTRLTFYLDDRSATRTFTGVVDASGSLYIGCAGEEQGRYIDGVIDEVMIFNRALREEEMRDIRDRLK